MVLSSSLLQRLIAKNVVLLLNIVSRVVLIVHDAGVNSRFTSVDMKPWQHKPTFLPEPPNDGWINNLPSMHYLDVVDATTDSTVLFGV
jgi:hypothetical protein